MTRAIHEVANHLTAAAVVLPFICVAFGGSAFAAALIFPVYIAANLLGEGNT